MYCNTGTGSSKNIGCIQRGEEATGKSFHANAEAIVAHGFDAFMLENLLATLMTNGNVLLSDADWIVQYFEARGYTVRYFKLKAQDYGSSPVRVRLIWIGFKGKDPKRLRLEFVERMLRAMQISTVGTLDDYLLDVANGRQVDIIDRSDHTEAGKRTDYKSMHIALYNQVKLPWPPERQNNHTFRTRRRTPRAYEVVFFCHNAFPYKRAPDNEGRYPAEFLDANSALDRHVGQPGQELKYPWHDQVMTWTTTAQIMCRRAMLIEISHGIYDLCVSVFQLDGLELMQMVGWDLSYYDGFHGAGIPTHLAATKMAGNAYSGFMVCNKEIINSIKCSY